MGEGNSAGFSRGAEIYAPLPGRGRAPVAPGAPERAAAGNLHPPGRRRSLCQPIVCGRSPIFPEHYVEQRRFCGLSNGLRLESRLFVDLAGQWLLVTGCTGYVDLGALCPAMEVAFGGAGGRLKRGRDRSTVAPAGA